MKKITLLLCLVFCSISGFSQFPQNFEDPSVTVPNGFPAGWLVTNNGVGTAVEWTIANNAAVIINGTKSAFVNRYDIGAGNTSEDWLISPLTLIPTNGQLRFFAKQSLAGDNGTIYQVRVSTSASQSNLGAYTVLQQWTEAEMNAVFNTAEEKIVDFPAASFGTNVYIAFVRVLNQPTGLVTGDRWSLDDINVVQKCLNPTNLGANAIAASQANLFWNGSVGAVGYQLAVLPAAAPFEGIPTDSSVGASFLKQGLTQNTNYKYYVRSDCGNGNFSEWVGPFNFQTLAIGTACADPIVIPSLPYQTVDNTGNYGNTLAGPQLASCISGGTNYQSGNDVFYSYTATQDCLVSFTLSPTETRSAMFIYPSCAGLTGACLAAAGNTTNAPRIINLNVVAGTTYIIVISSNNQSPTVAYNLLIQCESCADKPINPTVSNIGLTGADFAWTAPAGSVVGYQVAVQPQGSAVPSGPGEYTTTTPGLQLTTQLNPATLYQYWVRSECSPGVFSAWVGPVLFNTQLCAPADQCTYIFRMTDSANNGWNGARMQIRQNGIILQTIGATYTSGAGPVDIPVTVCNNLPFDIFWSVAGTQPQQCIVSVINSFGQTIASIAGTSATVGTVIYSGQVNCTTPQCNLAPTGVTVSNITTTGGTINWTAPGTENVGYNIYIVPAGSTPPVAGTTPTYTGTNGAAAPFSFTIPVPNALLPDTLYDVYVQVICNFPSNSPWSAVSTFKTLPTCPKPTNQTVTGTTSPAPINGIVASTAVLGWTPGALETQWEVLLLAAPNAVVPAAPGITPVVGPGDFYIQNITGTAGVPQTLSATTTPALPALANATIYYYYVRAVCQPGNDASTWTGPFIFNTDTCDATQKCTYRFLLTNASNNNWNSGRMQVRQNGIVIATLGTGGINNANGIPVLICNNVPFDLFWSVAGTLPQDIGVTIINSNNDIVYTKLPGQGTPLTVLYSDTTLGNCEPPTCPKPTNLLVVSTEQTTANLSWTAGGSETQWEVYVVAQGGTPPVNGSPLVGGNTFPYYSANTNINFQVTGLTPGTQYQYYVRAICSPTDISTWTILNPASFITKPVNDDCAAAITVPVNPTQVCSQTVPGSTLGGTASPEISTCPGSENDDVWYTFVATNNIHIVSLLDVAGTTTNIRFAIYSGAECGTATQIFCSATNNNTAVLTNLTAGQTYKIRVYTNGNNPNQSASFNVCVSTPPAPGTNDECINAIPITVNTLSECLFVTPGNLIGATGSTGVSNACVGTEDDDVWFSFVATSGSNIISLLNVEGTTTNLNHAVYSGTCGSLTQLYCGAANNLTSNNTTYVIGQTYYVRVWSNGSNSEVVTFDICVRPISTCGNAAPFCGGTPQAPYIFPNSNALAGSSIGQVACLFTTPNPTYYTLHIGQTGPMNFTMVQNTQFNAQGQPVGTNLDVDFVAWGPFSSTDSCDQILFGPCSPPCPNNTTNPTFYPAGNVIDCSYSASFTETISIPNAQAGEFYIILITNFNGAAGFISLVQTNFQAPNAGTTICCDVDMGEDINACESSVTLNALEDVLDLNNVPVTFEWYFNDVLIPNQSGSTIVATASGTYTVKGNCGINAVEDTIIVTLTPPITVVSPADYEVCDTTPFDGFAPFDLNTLTPQVLGTLDPTLYNVSYYLSVEEATVEATTSIDVTVPFTNTVANLQTLYIRVENNALATCFEVVPVDLVVTTPGNPQFEYSAVAFCKNETINPEPIYIGGGSAGEFTVSPSGLVINASTGQVNLAASAPGTYQVTNTILGTGACANTSVSTAITINQVPEFTFTGTSSLCPDETGNLTAVVTNNTSSAPVSYTFTLPNGTQVTNSNGLLSIDDTGVYTVEVNILGCTSTQTFEVLPSNTQWNVTFSGTASLCPDENGTLTAVVTNNTNNSPVSYTFTLPNGTQVTNSNGVLAIDAPGVYSVVVNILGCTSTPVSYTVAESVSNWQVAFTGTPYVICSGESTTLAFTASNFDINNPNAVYTWTSPSGTTATGSTFVASQVGIYGLSVNILGCISTFTVEVQANTTAIDLDFVQGCENNQYRLRAQLSDTSLDPADFSFEWSGPNVVPTDESNTIILGANGTYSVTVTNAQGCSSTETITVNNISCVIQKGISPNNDGANDFFDLSTLNVKELFIYNRYGTEVYSLRNYVSQWNGQSNSGEELPDGTYFYVIQTLEGESITGWIFINR